MRGVHLDVYAATVEDLEALGAWVLQPAEEAGFARTVKPTPRRRVLRGRAAAAVSRSVKAR